MVLLPGRRGCAGVAVGAVTVALRVALLGAIILALVVLVVGITGCVTSPEPHPPVTCTPVEFCDTTLVYPGIGEVK